MQIIILSHMYPRINYLYSGVFVKEQVHAIKNKINCVLTVVVPTPFSPRVLWFRNKWREYGQAEKFKLDDNIKVYYPRYIVIPGKLFSAFEGIFMYISIRGIIKKLIKVNIGKPILHAHTLLPDGLAAILLRKEFNIKVVCTAHGSDVNILPFITKLSHLFTKDVLQKADALVAVSEKLKERMQNIFYRPDIKVVTNGVNIEKFRNNRSGENKFVSLLFVGNICFEKGIRELMQAFKILITKYNNVSLILVGKNTITKWLNSFIEENKLQNCVKLPGIVAHEVMKDYYFSASIFVLPSYREGMPTTMFEAMASRVPVVISKVGGVAEVIKDGINGLLVEPHSVEDLYNKLKILIENKELRIRLNENAFNDVVSKYTWDHNADKMINIYKNI